MAAKKDDKDAVAETVEQQAQAGNRLLEQGLDQATDMNRRQAEQVRALLGAGTRLYGDMGDIPHVDVENLIETSARLAKGAQDVGWEVMHYTQQSLQMGMRCANELMTCRTVEDMLQVQRNFVRQSVDSMLQESVRLLELSSGTVQSAVAPPPQQRQ